MKAVSRVLMAVLVGCVLSGCGTTKVLVQNSLGFDINDKKTKSKKIHPDWVTASNKRNMEEEKNNKIKIYIGLGKPDYDIDDDGYSEEEAKREARKMALEELAGSIFTDVNSEIKDNVVERNDVYYSEIEIKTRAKSRAVIQDFEDVESFWEKYRVGENVKDEKNSVDYYHYWRKFVISMDEYETAKKRVLNRADFIAGEKQAFTKIEERFRKYEKELAGFEINTEENFSHMLSICDTISAIRDDAEDLQTYTNTSGVMQEKDEKEAYNKFLSDLDTSLAVGNEKSTNARLALDEKAKTSFLVVFDGKIAAALASINDTVAMQGKDYDSFLSTLDEKLNSPEYKYIVEAIQAKEQKIKELEELKAGLENKLASNDGINGIKEGIILDQKYMIADLTDRLVALAGDDKARLNMTADQMLAYLSTTLSQPSIKKQPKDYTVKNGDTLASIARERYNGNAFCWLLIYAANPRQFPSGNPNRIRQGMKLSIPELPDSFMEYAPSWAAVLPQQ
ncbi:hypothetical protein AGMMS49944_00640 [Spirochaetia bacterium]|nr:hypothetical protein AGMMS49944_00640 [Spirochaetia bacterium]